MRLPAKAITVNTILFIVALSLYQSVKVVSPSMTDLYYMSPSNFLLDEGITSSPSTYVDDETYMNCSGLEAIPSYNNAKNVSAPLCRRFAVIGTGPFVFSPGLCYMVVSAHYNTHMGVGDSTVFPRYDGPKKTLWFIGVALKENEPEMKPWFSYVRLTDGMGKGSVRKVSLSYKEVKEMSLDLSVTKFTWKFYPQATQMRVIICKNGSVYTKWNPSESFPKCKYLAWYPVHEFKRGKRSGLDDCQVEAQKIDSGFHLKFRTTQNENIQVKTDTLFRTIFCRKQCSFDVGRVRELIITCENDKQHHLYLEKDVSEWCPGAGLKYFGTFAVLTCRASSHPWAYTAFIFWFVFGYPLMVIIGLSLVLMMFLMSRVILKLNIKYLKRKGICVACNNPVVGDKDQTLHSDRCGDGKCPFCAIKLTLSDLPTHSSKCEKRTEYYNSRREEMESEINKKLSSKSDILTGSKFRIGSWLLVLVSLLLVSISPVKATEEDDEFGIASVNHIDAMEYINKIKDQFKVEKEKTNFFLQAESQFENCDETCEIQDSVCICAAGPGGSGGLKKSFSRKRRSIDNSTFTDLVVPTKWGLINVKKTFLAYYDEQHIKMTWTNVEENGDDIVLTGDSIVYLKLEPHSGTTWELSSKLSNEKRFVTLSVYDFGQFYKTERQYFTYSRQVGLRMSGTCKGDCPETCTHNYKSYKAYIQKKWTNSRNWGCSPKWCWTISGGCTCCHAEFATKHPKWIASLWKTEYEETKVIACLQVTLSARKCKVVSAGDEIQIEQYTVKFTDVQSVDKKLPHKIMTLNLLDDIHDHEHYSIEMPKYIILDPDVCAKEDCRHGRIGDIQCNKPADFLTPWDCWGSWQNVDLDYKCHFAEWPTCVAAGVDKDNTYRFDELNRTGTHLAEEFTPLKIKMHDNGGQETLKLIVRPKSGAGTMVALLSAEGVALKSKTIKVKVEKLEIVSCKGCYGCMKGFSCTIKIQSNIKAVVHLEAKSTFIQLAENGVSSDQDSTESEVTGFSSISLNQITLCVKEQPEVCAGQELNLKEPENLLVERVGLIHSKTVNTTCSGTFVSCAGKSGKNFFESILEMLLYLISLWKWILLILVLIVAILVGKIVIMALCCLNSTANVFDPRDKLSRAEKGHKSKRNSNGIFKRRIGGSSVRFGSEENLFGKTD